MFLKSPPAHGLNYEFVVIGTGFGSMFFVHQLLDQHPTAKILMLEWGSYRPWAQQLEEERNTSIPILETFSTKGEDKLWNFTIAYGGGMNCWYGTTPRLHPSDFQTKPLYGHGRDWPLNYEALERYYVQAEQLMDVSGPTDMEPMFPRSAPYPQPPHRFSSVDKVLKKALPGQHFAQPTARARVANDQRNQCCATSRCNLCPQDAKFTVHNGMQHITRHPNVDILTGAEVRELERSGTTSVSAVRFRFKGKEYRAGCDVCVLGANAIHSAAILARSSISHPVQGRNLNEQLGYGVEAMLGGLQNFDGSSISTSINYALYDGEFRSKYGGALLIFSNWPSYGLRDEFGRWRETAVVIVNVEADPDPANRVTVDKNGDAVVEFAGRSSYAAEGARQAFRKIPVLLSALPVEKIEHKGYRLTESHLQGTLRMGDDPADSIVNRDLVHHQLRNLIVAGTSVFPTCPASPPSLTAAALSLRAADCLWD